MILANSTADGSSAPFITVDGLTIPGVLDHVSFTLERGERVGIIGESGSGKSLTALSIMGLADQPGLPPASGSVTVDGIEMVGTRDRTAERYAGNASPWCSKNR